MDHLESMRIFCSVVDVGGFAAAAEKLKQSTSVVSRAVSQLETHLKTRLLQRTTRKLSLTESGRAFYERCSQVLSDIEELEFSVSKASSQPKGVLKITAPPDFAVNVLSKLLFKFSRNYPEVTFDLVLSEQVLDIVAEGVDVAVRLGSPGMHNLIAREIGNIRMLCAAAPQYLQDRPQLMTPQDLLSHQCLIHERAQMRDVWRFVDKDKHHEEVKVGGAIHSNHSEFLIEMAIQGAGVVCAPCYALSKYIERGALVQVLPDYAIQELPIYLVYATRKHLSAKVRVFLDFVIESFNAPPPKCAQQLGLMS
jgi:DNA-binding transcriptional LysR family regulator